MNLKIFTYGDYRYRYHLFRQERKTVSLTVQPNLNIILRCPCDYPEKKIEEFLKRKWNWLEAQIRDLKKFQRKTEGKEYISGESFIYLGRQYRLLVEESRIDNVGLEKGRIIIKTTEEKSNKAYNQKLIQKWYERKAGEVLEERYCYVLKKFNYEFRPELALRKMEKRWGSFLAKKKILLNPELIKASKECIDYVITHELCHMRYQNHSKLYYKFLVAHCPNWKELKEKLELRFL